MAKQATISLPIAQFQEKLIETVEKNDCVIVTGETGCGKTTQLPKYLYQAGISGQGIIGVTQPRRVAALSVAARVAEEMGVTLGSTVGYQVRFDDYTSKDTRIKYLTDGCLLREFLDDPNLSKYSVVILDEAHERSLSTDILFGLMRRLYLAQRQESEHDVRRTKIVIMSATLDSQKFSQFFDGCPVLAIPGRVYPVDVSYCLNDEESNPKQKTLPYMSHVCRVVMEIHLEEPKGDVLVFLTGQKEIENACDRLYTMSKSIDYEHDVRCASVVGMMVLPLYGSMPTDQQRRVFAPGPAGVRRIIVATNIAATSLTVDGVVYVVDSGFVKQSSYNPRTGLDSLGVVPVARSEAEQRAGRAGRTAPGQCYRLYSRAFHAGMAANTVPEVQRSSLTGVVLDLKCSGVDNVVDFPYLDAPEERMVLEALRQLHSHQCLDGRGQVTVLGRRVVQYPLQPSLARAVIRSRQLLCSEAVLPIVAMLSVEEMFIQPPGKKQGELAARARKEIVSQAGGTSDFATLLAVYRLCTTADSPQRWCRDNFVHWRSIKLAQSIVAQLEGILHRQDIAVDSAAAKSCSSLSERVRLSLCYGLFGNVARRTPGRPHFRTMDGHCTTAYLHPGSTLFGRQEEGLDWVLYHQLVDTARPYMRTVCPVRYAWIQDLLPLLHKVDAYQLSGSVRHPTSPTATCPDSEAPSAKRTRQDNTTGSRDGSVSVQSSAVSPAEAKKRAAQERYRQRKALTGQGATH